MKNLTSMQKRFMKDSPPVRMGNLASELSRLSQWVMMGRPDEAVIDLMRKIAWLLEWSGDTALPELPDMQREICRWRRSWPADSARSVLSLRARIMSERILEESGLTNPKDF